MEITYTPSVCKETADGEGKKKKVVKPTFKGELVLKAPSFQERSKYRKMMGVTVDQKGDVDMPADLYSVLLDLSEHVPKHILKVDLERLSDGKAYKTWDDLSYNPECEPIIYELTNVIANGVQVGKQ